MRRRAREGRGRAERESKRGTHEDDAAHAWRSEDWSAWCNRRDSRHTSQPNLNDERHEHARKHEECEREVRRRAELGGRGAAYQSRGCSSPSPHVTVLPVPFLSQLAAEPAADRDCLLAGRLSLSVSWRRGRISS